MKNKDTVGVLLGRMEKKMETTSQSSGLGVMAKKMEATALGYILGLYRDNGQENGICYMI